MWILCQCSDELECRETETCNDFNKFGNKLLTMTDSTSQDGVSLISVLKVIRLI